MAKNKENINELPMEEFENDTQNTHVEFLKKFPHKKDETVEEEKK